MPNYKIAPLSGTFMLTSMIGVLLSLFLMRRISLTWGFAFLLVFIVMFVASLMSIRYANADALYYVDEKTFHKDQKYKKKLDSKLKKMKSPALKVRSKIKKTVKKKAKSRKSKKK